ncbi:hypothetical protein CEUSTIGMA_g2883.t1 [Chlamydomonas eustigma]|uniref:Protein NEOXANTHIN-DEFICIENT 1 n=1 Tax=Chlamydomonas eustigma TaxID=1157962 RepID=A0A250WXL2_9CHLO|nr:hypothetical protein CEUSTIGMA_g2883.t1 [Chlamydomonas eustigma]|eukprot:GAX75439.1 hypothetical protein CEUSTIGMA_g2883.t1 [Chlamydomonas eustigma]
MGYGEAPWVFKGRALYQLQLVKVDEAKKYMPKELKLVELFGYTLGGFYLARYDDSPVGAFDELVVLAGLAWNPPTSCAWAARVYVNNKSARDHGLHSVGLPSRLADFSASSCGPADKSRSWWWQSKGAGILDGKNNKQIGGTTAPGCTLLEGDLCIKNMEKAPSRSSSSPVCSLQLPPALEAQAWSGPRIRLALPSFSGGTPDHPDLLKYACDLLTCVRPVSPAVVILPKASTSQEGQGKQGKAGSSSTTELLSSVLNGAPVLALAFEDMVMTVQEPVRAMYTLSPPVVGQSGVNA